LKRSFTIADPTSEASSQTKGGAAHGAPPDSRLAGLPKKSILASDWPLIGDFDQVSLSRALSDVPDWLQDARLTKGARGKQSSTWNPALIGACLVAQEHAIPKAIARFIKSIFPEWLDDWEEWSESHSV
jgi:hypothetical protein